LSQGRYAITIVTKPESEHGQAYSTIKSLFILTKKMYSQNDNFISASDLSIEDAKHQGTVRTTNLATWVMSVFGGNEINFYDLDETLIDIFTPDDQPFSSEVANLCIGFKTQMFLSSISSQDEMDKVQEKVHLDLLDYLFPDGLADTVLARHPELPLSPSENVFLDGCNIRRKELLKMLRDPEMLRKCCLYFKLEFRKSDILTGEFSDKSPWESFLIDVSAHLKTEYECKLPPYMKHHDLKAPASPTRAFISLKDNIEFSPNQAEKTSREAIHSFGSSPATPMQNGGP
jgi:hypothetical protein